MRGIIGHRRQEINKKIHVRPGAIDDWRAVSGWSMIFLKHMEIKYLDFLYTIQVNSALAHNDWLVQK